MTFLPRISRHSDNDGVSLHGWYFVWDCDDAIFELELFDNGLCDWFFRNRITNDARGPSEDAEQVKPFQKDLADAFQEWYRIAKAKYDRCQG